MTPPIPDSPFFEVRPFAFNEIKFKCGDVAHTFYQKDGIKQRHLRLLISGVAAVESNRIGNTIQAVQWLEYGAGEKA